MILNAEHLSFSRLNTLNNCGKKYSFKYIDKKPRGEPLPDSFLAGKIVDKALLLAKEKEVISFDDYILKDKVEFQDDKWLNWCKGIWSERRSLYNKIYGIADIELQIPIKIKMMDLSGEIMLDSNGKELDMIGYLDAWDQSLNEITEVKTTGAPSVEQVHLDYLFGGQTQIYAYAKYLENGSIPLVNYVYIKKPKIRQKKTESLEEFYIRLYDMGKDPEILIKPVQYTIEQLQETMAYYFEMVTKLSNKNDSQNRAACFTWGSRCEYFGYCWKHQEWEKPDDNN